MMLLGHPIQLRLKQEMQLAYQEEAASLGKPLASFLRERLEAQDETRAVLTHVRCEIASLRLLMEDIEAQKNIAGNNNSSSDATLLELLLLLRQLCRPEHVKIAQGELNRLGYSIRTL